MNFASSLSALSRGPRRPKQLPTGAAEAPSETPTIDALVDGAQESEQAPPTLDERVNGQSRSGWGKALLGLAGVAGGVALARKGRGGPLMAAIGAGADSLQQSNERKRKAKLEDLLTQDRLATSRAQREHAAAETRKLGQPPKPQQPDYEQFQDEDGNWYVRNRYDAGDVRPLSVGGKQVRGRRQRDMTQPPPPSAAQREDGIAEAAMRALQAAGGDIGKAEAMLAGDPENPWSRANMQARVRHLRTAKDRYDREGRNDSNRSFLGGATGTSRSAAYTSPDEARADYDDAASKLRAAGIDPQTVLGPRP